MTKTIVWIDDDIDIIEPVAQPLMRAGFEVTPLRNAAEASETMEKICDADVVLLDLILPPGRTERTLGYYYPGIDILREIREVYQCEVPVVVLTVVTNSDTLEELRKLRASHIMHKPVRPSELQRRVQEVLENSH